MKKTVLKILADIILNESNQNKIWSCSDFNDLPFNSVTKALSLLCQKGIITRIQKGYYCVHQRTIIGDVPCSDTDLLFKKLSEKGCFYCISGLSGYNKIGLTTQIPNTITIACNAPMRSTDKIKFIKRRKPSSGTEVERIVLDALYDIDNMPGASPCESLLKVKDLILSNIVNINDLGRSAVHESPRVRAIAGALGQELCMDEALLQHLKKSLNPSTVYLLDATSSLKYPNEWKIKKQEKIAKKYKELQELV